MKSLARDKNWPFQPTGIFKVNGNICIYHIQVNVVTTTVCVMALHIHACIIYVLTNHSMRSFERQHNTITERHAKQHCTTRPMQSFFKKKKLAALDEHDTRIHLHVKCKSIFTKMLKDVVIEAPKSMETRSKCSMHADKVQCSNDSMATIITCVIPFSIYRCGDMGLGML